MINTSYYQVLSVAVVLMVLFFHWGLGRRIEVKNHCRNLSSDVSRGKISSPVVSFGFSFTYPSRSNCTWVIKNKPGMIITLSFPIFDLEEEDIPCHKGYCCSQTFVSLSIPLFPVSQDMHSLGPVSSLNYCGRNQTIRPLFIENRDLIVHFQSGYSFKKGKGFVMEYLIGKTTRQECDHGYYQCSNRKCIPTSWKCNGADECGDNSDEYDCTDLCPHGSVRCGKDWSKCYDVLKDECNGVPDCPDGEDEQHCKIFPESIPSIKNSLPSPDLCLDQSQCKNRIGCFNLHQRCDGSRECGDQSDEEECSPSMCGPHRGGFLCRDRRCIPAVLKCDGIPDCLDYSDEENCMKMSVITAVILGSLLCGLLLVIAAGCGLRLYHLRVSLERRWTALRQRHNIQSDFDEFGRRRPVMGRQPPPTYAQAMGAIIPISGIHSGQLPSSRPVPHRPRRHSRRSRRSTVQSQSATVETPPIVEIPSSASAPSSSESSLLQRFWRRWRKSRTDNEVEISPISAPAPVGIEQANIMALDHATPTVESDTFPLVESQQA